MRLGSRRALAVLVAAVVCAGAAFAGSADAAKRHHGALLRAAAQYIGVPRGEVVKEARGGQTLAQIATAHGKTVDGLKSAMLAALKTRFDAAVSAKRLTPAQAQARLARAQKLVDRIVNAHLGKAKDALLKPFEQRLANASAAGRISSTQAQTRLAKISARLDEIINRTR